MIKKLLDKNGFPLLQVEGGVATYISMTHKVESISDIDIEHLYDNLYKVTYTTIDNIQYTGKFEVANEEHIFFHLHWTKL